METAKNEKGKRTKPTKLSLKKQMIVRVCRFLSEEYNFIRLHNVDNCKLAPLVGIASRASQATGVTSSYISRIYKPYKERAASLLSNSGLSRKQVRQKTQMAKEANDTIHVLNDIKTVHNSDEERATKNSLLDNIFAIKQETLDNEQEIPIMEQEMLDIKQETLDIKQEPSDNEQEIPIMEQEMLDIKQETLDIKQEPSDNEQEIPSIEQEIKQEILDIKQESLDNKQEISSIKQETLYIQQEAGYELGERNTKIDFETEITANTLMSEELKTEKLSNYAYNLRSKKNSVTRTKAQKKKDQNPSCIMTEDERKEKEKIRKKNKKKGKKTKFLQLHRLYNPSKKRKQEENERQTLLFEDEVKGKPNLDQILQVDDDEHLTTTKKGDNYLLPSNKLEANVVEIAKFEEEELNTNSYYMEDCYVLVPKLEINVSETSASEQFNCYEPSSSNNNLFHNYIETEDIAEVCIKNEVHSDSSDE